MELYQNLTVSVTQALGRDIATGRYPSGTTLPAEKDLVIQFNASRTVLREAVKMLTAKGLVDTRPRRGTMVRPESEWNLADPDILSWLLHRKNVLPLIIEFADIRLAIEPAGAALAARMGNDEAIAEVELAMQRMRDASTGNDDPLESDIAFHSAVLKASGNRFFWSLRYMVEVALRFSIRITNTRRQGKGPSLEAHQRILEAIKERDPKAAETAMHALILESKMLLYEEKRQGSEASDFPVVTS